MRDFRKLRIAKRSQEFKVTMLSNAEEIRRLNRRIKDAFALQDKSEENYQEWRKACSEFHARYDTLAFPGGYLGAHERIVAGDVEAMEAAICFLEIRPYFFRSGYIFRKILGKAKQAPLSEEQAARLRAVIEKFDEWKREKASR